MFRKHIRITLEITGIRVERLDDISEDDAKREGVESAIPTQGEPLRYKDYLHCVSDPFEWFGSARESFQSLWGSINGQKSWDENPYVWVIEFKKV